ncbi:MAG: hypothetical protein WD407_06255 [Rhodospirillales bacterium]
MFKLIVATFLVVAFATGAVSTGAYAQTGYSNTKKPTPKQKIQQVLPAQPPKVSTGTKPSMVGVPTQEFKPRPPKMKTIVVPSPK